MSDVTLKLLKESRRRVGWHWIQHAEEGRFAGVCMIGAIKKTLTKHRDEFELPEYHKAEKCLLKLVAESLPDDSRRLWPYEDEDAPHIHASSIVNFNDRHGRKKREVLKVFDEAISKYKTCAKERELEDA